MARSAGSSVQLMSKEGDTALLRLPSGEMRNVPMDCRATVGTVGNAEAELTKLGKQDESMERCKTTDQRCCYEPR